MLRGSCPFWRVRAARSSSERIGERRLAAHANAARPFRARARFPLGDPEHAICPAERTKNHRHRSHPPKDRRRSFRFPSHFIRSTIKPRSASAFAFAAPSASLAPFQRRTVRSPPSCTVQTSKRARELFALFFRPHGNETGFPLALKRAVGMPERIPEASLMEKPDASARRRRAIERLDLHQSAVPFSSEDRANEHQGRQHLEGHQTFQSFETCGAP